MFTECETSYQGLVRGRDADALVAIQTGKCLLGVALESLKPTRVCVCVWCVRVCVYCMCVVCLCVCVVCLCVFYKLRKRLILSLKTEGSK